MLSPIGHGLNDAAQTLAVIIMSSMMMIQQAIADEIHVPADYPTIQQAIDAATDGDEILVAPGVYRELINFSGKAITVRAEERRTAGITRPQGSFETLVTFTSGEMPASVLEGFVIFGARGNFFGAMYVETASPTIRDCLFQGNKAGAEGGAINIRETLEGYTASIIDCEFRDNEAPIGGYGGAVNIGFRTSVEVLNCVFESNVSERVGGAIYLDSNDSVSIGDCIFRNNVSSDNWGGAIGIKNDGQISVEGCVFESNYGDKGGGAIRMDDGSVPRIVDCHFLNNAAHGSGGAIYVWQDAQPVIERCRFESNVADSSGGAIYGSSRSTPEILHCDFEDNWGRYGGAIYADWLSNTTIDACTFVNNMAESGGGALELNDQSNTMITNCEFRANQVGDRGGAMHLVNDSTCSVSHSVFEENSAGMGGGAIALLRNCSITLEDCDIARNDAMLNGGAVLLDWKSVANIRFCDLVDNTAQYDGGAIHVQRESTATVESSVLAGNSSIGTGCIHVEGLSTLNLIDSLVDENQSALLDGALSIDNSTAYLRGSTIQRNVGGDGAGAIYLQFGNATILQCLFDSNYATGGPDCLSCYEQRSLDVANCTFVRNGRSSLSAFEGSHGEFANCIMDGYLTLYEGSDLRFRYCNIFDSNPPGEHNINEDSMFVDPANGDFRLLPGSPCIDAADNLAVPPEIETDLDGLPRFADDVGTEDTGNGTAPIVDMGVYEFHGATGYSLTVSPQPLRSDEYGTFTLHHAVKGDLAFLAYSTSGLGRTYVDLLKISLELKQPRQAGRAKRVQSDGMAVWNLYIPEVTSRVDVWFQAAQFEHVSNVVETYIE